MFTFPVPGPIIWSGIFPERVYPLQRPRLSKSRVYQPLIDQRALRNWMEKLKPEIPYRCDTWIECIFVQSDRHEADLDNLLKAVFDSLQATGVIVNDRRIVGGNFVRCIGDSDQCHIHIREARPYDPSEISNGSD